ncbi:hypothetical protein NCS57_00510500 [Fusarium keratoplasticum]|uniref:Uncharacterized protein n=1 Tax=Fusarium keratoplasticum TaxID=1328300 RepID=A0ACC0R6W3_9HYPO|nr:hypothetical protein NCS57_00510500 [Fusarium keratoplasticum]KAI8676071.1 hypothetical protein NCS57_00510500 [Fusarium keratoplasticum]
MASDADSVTNDGWCHGQIQANSDIAGWGTIATLAVNASMGMLFSLRLWLAKTKNIYHDARSGQPSTAMLPFYSESMTPWDELLISIADTNLISALGIVISSLVNLLSDIDAYPNYHLWIAWILADLAIMGFGAASQVYHKIRYNEAERYRLIPRTILAGVTWALWMCWTCLILDRFRAWEVTWEAEKSHTPQCFSTHLDMSDRFTFTFWIYINLFWVSQSFVWIISTPFRVHAYLDRWLYIFDIWLVRLAISIPRAAQHLVRRRGSRIASIIIGCIWLFYVPPIYGVVLFLLPSHIMDLPFVLIFIPWDIYDIYIAKKSNRGIVVDVPTLTLQESIRNSESDWGFGQIFPMVFIIILLLNFTDAYLGSRTPR